MPKQIVVEELPTCDFCPEPARYDGRVRAFGGPVWAYCCPSCWERRRFDSSLGTGKGQRLVLAHEGSRVKDKEPLPRMAF